MYCALRLNRIEHTQNMVRALADRNFRQYVKLIAEREIHMHQPFIFGDCTIDVVTTLCILHIDFRPRRRHEHAMVIAPRKIGCGCNGFACQMLQTRYGIDQPAVEEHPLIGHIGFRQIDERKIGCTMQERMQVMPWQGRAIRLQFRGHDASARLRNHSISTPREFIEQRRFAPARTSRDNDTAVYTRTRK